MPSKFDNGFALQVLRVIQQHPECDPITGHVLALRFQVNLRCITLCIEYLRFNGYPICVSKGKVPGYFYPTDISQLIPVIEQRRKQAINIMLGNKKMLEYFNKGQQTIWDEMAEIDLQARDN